MNIMTTVLSMHVIITDSTPSDQPDNYNFQSPEISCSDLVSSVPWPIGSWGEGGGAWGTIQQRSSSTFLMEAIVGSSEMGRDVHSLALSIQHFLNRPRCRPASKVPWRMVLERLSWSVTCPNHQSFRLSVTVMQCINDLIYTWSKKIPALTSSYLQVRNMAAMCDYASITNANTGKTRERFRKNAGEWTGRLEISEDEIPGNKFSLYDYIPTYSRL